MSYCIIMSFCAYAVYTKLMISLTACEDKNISGAKTCDLYKVSAFLIIIACYKFTQHAWLLLTFLHIYAYMFEYFSSL